MNEQEVQQIAQLEAAVKPLFTKDALMRYHTIKLAHPEQAVRVLLVIAQTAQQKQITVTDEQLKQLLVQLQPQRKEIKIRR